MAKYDPLYSHFSSRMEKRVVLSYAEIEKIISAELPRSAYKYKAWWDNNSHTQSRSWRAAGYAVANIELGNEITFVKE